MGGTNRMLLQDASSNDTVSENGVFITRAMPKDAITIASLKTLVD
jgi:hypothetical protein